MLQLHQHSSFVEFYQNFQKTKPTEEILINHLKLLVFRDVFSPDPSASYASTLVLKHMQPLSGLRVLDLGCGCGVFAIHAALNNAKSVTAVDANHLAIINTWENLKRLNVSDKVQVQEGDLFDALSADEAPYDLIVAHLPVFEDEVCFNRSLIQLYYALTLNAASFLETTGRMLISYPSFGDAKTLYFLQHHPLITKVFSENHYGVDWHIFELRVPKADVLRDALRDVLKKAQGAV